MIFLWQNGTGVTNHIWSGQLLTGASIDFSLSACNFHRLSWNYLVEAAQYCCQRKSIQEQIYAMPVRNSASVGCSLLGPVNLTKLGLFGVFLQASARGKEKQPLVKNIWVFHFPGIKSRENDLHIVGARICAVGKTQQSRGSIFNYMFRRAFWREIIAFPGVFDGATEAFSEFSYL
jgi:hypothetical protein